MPSENGNTADLGVLNRYSLIKELGQGGMGIVYLVEDQLKDNMLFALKTIRQNVITKYRNAGIERFKNEYEIMTRLKHPNLTRVYEFGECRNNYYIVMEYLDGTILSDFKAKNIRLKVDIIVQILRALEYIHSRNIIYRDIKPGNIMIVDGKAKLMDFGLSGFIRQKENAVRGTLAYISPEAITGDLSFSMDIFSLGIVFYELISEKRFYDDKKTMSKTIITLLDNQDNFLKYQSDNLKFVKQKPLRHIIQKMTSFDAHGRYKACSEIIADINDRLNYSFEYETKETRESYVLGNAFANRTEEMDLLRANTSKRYKKHLFLYSGPSGVGKTRLFTEFKKYCRLNGIYYFETSCIEGELKNYNSFAEVLSQLISFSSESLLDQFGRYLKIILPNNSSLKKYKSLETTESPKDFQNLLIQNISDYILEFAKSVDDKIVIIYFNDLQWLDEGSMYIFSSIVNRLDNGNDRIFNLLFYANINETKLRDKSNLAKFLRANVSEKYDLLPLDNEGVSEYIENIFGEMFLDISIKESIINIKERIGGNPLFLEELIKSLIDKEIIIKDKVYWKLLKSISEVDIPDNIMEIIRARLQKLFMDDNKRKILKILSMLRIELDIKTIKCIIDHIVSADVDTAKVLLELENMEILQAKKVEDAVYYSYSSSIIKDQIRDSIDNSTEISLFLAKILESIPQSPDYDFTEEIAHLYENGNDREKAALYYEKCGDTAAKNYFNDKAVKFYENALGLLKEETDYDREKEIIIMLKIGSILVLRGDSKKSAEIYRCCIETSENTGHKKLLAESYLNYGWLRYSSGEFSKALEYFNISRMIFQEIDDRQGIGYSTGNMGLVYSSMGRYEKALECYKIYENTCIETKDKRGIATAMGNMGSVYYKLGQYSRALECYEHKRKVATEIGDKQGIGNTMGNMGNVYFSLGQYQEALECHEIHKRISEEIGDKARIGIATGNIQLIYYYLGEYSKALEYYEICKKIFNDIGNKQGIGISTANTGLIYLAQGKYSEALKCFEVYKKISEEIGDKSGIAMAIGFTGSVYYEIGDSDKALLCLEDSIGINKELNVKNFEFVESLILKSKLLLLGNNIRDAEKTIDEAMHIAEHINNSEYILRAKIQKQLIVAADNKPAAISSLCNMLSGYLSEEQKADIYYELYILDESEHYRKSALELYESLCNIKSKYQYLLRMQVLSRGKKSL